MTCLVYVKLVIGKESDQTSIICIFWFPILVYDGYGLPTIPFKCFTNSVYVC